jgi:hypothetical protein
MTEPVAADPVTTEATLLWKLPDRIVAMCVSGLTYTWEVKTSGLRGMFEGVQVFVTFDPDTKRVFSICPVGSQDAPG